MWKNYLATPTFTRYILHDLKYIFHETFIHFKSSLRISVGRKLAKTYILMWCLCSGVSLRLAMFADITQRHAHMYARVQTDKELIYFGSKMC